MLDRFCYIHCVCFDSEWGWIYTLHIGRISRIDSVWSEWVNWFRNTWHVIDKMICFLIIVVIAYLKASLCAAKLVVEYQRIGYLCKYWIMSTVNLGHIAIWLFAASVKFIWSGKNPDSTIRKENFHFWIANNKTMFSWEQLGEAFAHNCFELGHVKQGHNCCPVFYGALIKGFSFIKRMFSTGWMSNWHFQALLNKGGKFARSIGSLLNSSSIIVQPTII